MTDLGTLGGTNSRGFSINASGQVLGDSQLNTVSDPVLYDPGSVVDYFLYTPGSGMVDFQTLIDPGSGWDIPSLTPLAINDAGQIVGTGFIGGQYDAFLLTPVPEPASWVFAVAGAAVAGGIFFGQYYDRPGLCFFIGIGGAIVGSVAWGVREIVTVLQERS